MIEDNLVVSPFASKNRKTPISSHDFHAVVIGKRPPVNEPFLGLNEGIARIRPALDFPPILSGDRYTMEEGKKGGAVEKVETLRGYR